MVHNMHRHNGTNYNRILWRFVRCINCQRGGVAEILDINGDRPVIREFLPFAIEQVSLPTSVPSDLVNEFREAEKDAAYGAYRSASALLRSVLEKCLKKNGYDEVEVEDSKGAKRKTKQLIHRIEAAADDGVITQARKKRAHENIRVLGNDILHDDWREVSEDEYEDAHRYTQRILEDLYDSRETVEDVLKSKKRPFTTAVPSAGATNP